MITRAGNHQKWTIHPECREALRALFLEGFGATVKTPRPSLDLFELSDGTFIGAFYDADALDAGQARKGTWLEFKVDDVEEGVKRLTALRLARVEYADTDHPYFQAPGGPVFRLARS